MHYLRLLRLSALGAVAFSTVAAVDAYGPGRAFCGPDGGCAKVAASGVGQFLGQVLPATGVVAYAGILVLSLSSVAPIRRLALVESWVGGVIALLLLGVQGLHIGAFCGPCVGVDVCALLTAGFAWAGRGTAQHDGPVIGNWPPSAWAALLLLAAGGPVAYASSKPTPVPEAVRSLWKPGKINVVEFSDFECPFCRAMHPVLEAALSPYGERVHFVRLSYPLMSHRHASAAAIAYLCAERQGRGDAMADALFSIDPLDEAGRLAAARDAGLDLEALRKCEKKDSTAYRTLSEHRETVKAAGMEGLPTVWIGRAVIKGFRESRGAEPYEKALRAAAEGGHATFSPLPWLVLCFLTLVLVTMAARSARERSGQDRKSDGGKRPSHPPAP